MTRQAKTKATPTTAPSNFQNKCCSIRAERQLLNSFLLDELHVIFSTYPVELHSGVVLAWKLEHGAHSSATTNSSTSQHRKFEVLTKDGEKMQAPDFVQEVFLPKVLPIDFLTPLNGLISRGAALFHSCSWYTGRYKHKTKQL